MAHRDKGAHVDNLKESLIESGDLWEGANSGNHQGVYGREVMNAVRRFEARHGLPVDGQADSQMLTVLREELNARAASLPTETLDGFIDTMGTNGDSAVSKADLEVKLPAPPQIPGAKYVKVAGTSSVNVQRTDTGYKIRSSADLSFRVGWEQSRHKGASSEAKMLQEAGGGAGVEQYFFVPDGPSAAAEVQTIVDGLKDPRAIADSALETVVNRSPPGVAAAALGQDLGRTTTQRVPALNLPDDTRDVMERYRSGQAIRVEVAGRLGVEGKWSTPNRRLSRLIENSPMNDAFTRLLSTASKDQTLKGALRGDAKIYFRVQESFDNPHAGSEAKTKITAGAKVKLTTKNGVSQKLGNLGIPKQLAEATHSAVTELGFLDLRISGDLTNRNLNPDRITESISWSHPRLEQGPDLVHGMLNHRLHERKTVYTNATDPNRGDILDEYVDLKAQQALSLVGGGPVDLSGDSLSRTSTVSWADVDQDGRRWEDEVKLKLGLGEVGVNLKTTEIQNRVVNRNEQKTTDLIR